MPHDNDDHVNDFFDFLHRTAAAAKVNMLVKGLIIEEIIDEAFSHNSRLKTLSAEKDLAKTALKIAFDMVGGGKSLGRALSDQGYAKHSFRGVAGSPVLKAYWATWLNAIRNRHQDES